MYAKRDPNHVPADESSRQIGAELRKDSADSREATADIREATADTREATADIREATADSREATADTREATADTRESDADIREATADTREAVADAQKLASQYARSLIEASLDPLIMINPDGKITDVNEATIKVTGVLRENLIATDFSDYFTEPDMARDGYQRVFAEGSVTDYPLTIRHSQGRLIHVVYNASLYKDPAGRVVGVCAAARDVTAQKLAEADVIEQREIIEQRAIELERLGELELLVGHRAARGCGGNHGISAVERARSHVNVHGRPLDIGHAGDGFGGRSAGHRGDLMPTLDGLGNDRSARIPGASDDGDAGHTCLLGAWAYLQKRGDQSSQHGR